MTKHLAKRLLAAALSASMAVSLLPGTVLADDISDEELMAELQAYSEEYPDGGFAFYNSQLETSEGDGSLYVDVVRMGGTAGEASVTFKAIDVSAVYGEDYTMSVEESALITRELEQDAEAKPITELIGDAESETVLGEESTEEPEPENVVEIGVDPEEGIVEVNENFEDGSDQTADPTEEQTPETTPEEENGGVSEEAAAEAPAETEPEETAAEAGLKAARAAYTGESSDRKPWQEMTGTEDADAAALAEDMSENNGYIAEFAEGMPGTEYTLEFADGEFRKRIRVDLIDDDISETDEQIMLVLMNEQGAELAKPNTAYINITDNDDNEQVVFSLPDGAVSVYPEDGYAYINVERISGTEKFASVTLSTGAITAEPDKDYASGRVEVIFPQGTTSRTVKIPIYDMGRSEAVSFAVAIDQETAFADPDTSSMAVTIEPSSAAPENTAVSVMDAGEGPAAPENAGIELYATTDSYTPNVRANSPSSGTNFGSYVNVLTGLDLRNADSIVVSYSSSGSYTYNYPETVGSGCDAKTVTRTGTRTGKQGQLTVGGVSVNLGSGSGTVTIENFSQSQNQSLQLRARRTESGNNGTISYTVTSVKVNYDDIDITVDSAAYPGVNTYTEKIYQTGGTNTDAGNNNITYTEGNTIQLGIGCVEDGATYTASKYTDTLTFTIKSTESTQATSQGVEPIEGTNVYLAGWQVYNRAANMYYDDIIKPGDMNLKTIYSKYGALTNIMVRPVIYPYTSLVRFNNSYPNELGYTNNISNGQELKISMLDTLVINAVGINNSGYAVDSFLLNGYHDSTMHGTSGSDRANNANNLRNKNASEVKKYLDDYKSGTDEVQVIGSTADSGRVTVAPNCEAIYVDMTYTQPNIVVQYNPSGAAPTEHQAEGSVFYWDSDDPENSKSGDYETPMTLMPVTFGTLYDINAVYSDSGEGGISNYKTVWQDFTGDVDAPFGQLSEAEQNALASYDLDRNAVTGDTFTYNPKATNSLIYYYFTERTKGRSNGVIDGTVVLKDYPIFGSDDVTYTPINGASVTVDGISTSTAYDPDFGGLNGTGGDGYFKVENNTFISGEAHRVNVVYGSLSTAASQNVNVARQYVLDAYETISVSSATKAKNGVILTDDEAMLNDDANYTLTFATNSSNAALVAQKAVLKFYRRDGSYVTSVEYNSTGNLTGVFECTFNPASLGLPAGGKITVTFTDNQGTTYFEHDTGLVLMQSLGMISLVTSFSGKAAPALAVIGTISSAFDFGWDGDLDDAEGKIGSFGTYSVETTADKKVLNVGLEFSKKGDNGDDKKDESSKEAVKDTAENGTAEEKKQAAQNVEQGDNKTQSELALGYNVELTFGITLTLAASEEPEHLGEWYFEEFMIVVNAGADLSVSRSFVTPIGIPIIVGASIGASGNAIVVVERRLGSAEYYMADLTSDSMGSVDLVNSGQSLSDYFYVYGDFTIAPYIGLSAGVGIDMFNIKLNGKADLELLFNTKTQDNSGSVTFTCGLSIKILFFETEFDLGSAEVSLFEAGPNLYEGLDRFDVSDREYLANRSGWNSQNEVELNEVSGYNETMLMDGVNPNTDTQMASLGDGRYLAVFVDDVPDRTASNSTAVFWSVYDGSAWSEPEMLEDDGTADDSPAIYDLENGQLFVAWSTADREFGDDPAMIDVLNSRNIHGRFFDAAAGEFGETIEVTTDTNEDVYADNDVQIAYDKETGKMLIYYTKSEYEATEGEEGVFGDAVYPYSLITYRIYNTQTGEFEGYSAAEEAEIRENLAAAGAEDIDEAYAEYVENYYGQRFLDLAPLVTVSETLDESGYWTEEPTITEFTGNDPLVVESDAISYNGLSLFAYILDYDGDKSTTNDRDVFMQIYDFTDDSVSHPIMITSNDVEEKSLQFERIGGGITFLSYISGGNIEMFDVSTNISNEAVTVESATEDGEPYYYLNKTQESGYIPEIPAVSASGGGDYTGDQEIVDFDLKTGDDYFYIMFTERTTKLKDGIEPGTEEAALAENNLVETQIYMTRYDIANMTMTEPVRVTEEEGANYANVAFGVDDNEGGFVAMATKSTSSAEELDGTMISNDGSDNSALYGIVFTPEANVTLREPGIDGIAAGAMAKAGFEVYNGGLESIDGLTVEVTDADGNAIDVFDNSGAEYTDENGEPVAAEETENTLSLGGGEFTEINFELPVAADANGAGFTATVKNAEGETLDTIEYSDSVARTADVVSFNADITDRGVIEYRAVVKNNGVAASGDSTFSMTAGGNTLYTQDIASLAPGESTEVSGTLDFDYDELFTSVTNDDGSVSADTEITATAGSESLTDTVSLFADAEQMARMNAVTDVSFAAEDSAEVTVGSYFALDPQITAENYSGRYEDNNEEEIDAQGVTLMFVSDNEDVARVYQNGFVEGVSEGTAKITALLMPSDSTFDGTDYISDYPTLPNEAIRSYTFDVTVAAEPTATRRPGSGGGGGNVITVTPTPAPTGTPAPEASETPAATAEPGTATEAPTGGVTTVFTDVASTDWFSAAVGYVSDNGIMVGVSDTEFAPNLNITRAMFAAILYRISGETAESSETAFTDVPTDTWYSEAVAWCSEHGIVLGISDTEFAPDNIITREQLCAMLKRYIDYTGAEYEIVNDAVSFTDAGEISDYAVEAVNEMAAYGVVNGRDAGEFDPQSGATRAECAAVIMNFMNLKTAGGEE